MGTVILLLIFIFIIMPIIRVMIAIYSAHRKARKAFQQFSQQQSQQASQQYSQARSNRYEDVGEYAEFEEISTSASDQQETIKDFQRSNSRESQVVDAEWEEIN